MSQADLQNSARLQSGSKAGGIEAITHLCMDTKCRRQTLLKHFNESRYAYVYTHTHARTHTHRY